MLDEPEPPAPAGDTFAQDIQMAQVRAALAKTKETVKR